MRVGSPPAANFFEFGAMFILWFVTVTVKNYLIILSWPENKRFESGPYLAILAVYVNILYMGRMKQTQGSAGNYVVCGIVRFSRATLSR